MTDELDKIIGDEENDTPPKPPEETPKEEETPEEETQEEKNKKVQEQATKQLADTAKAAGEELRKIRTIRKKVSKVAEGEDEDDELPPIDHQDPSVKAWDKHIGHKIDPVNKQIEMEKDEVRNLALKDFLADKPALAKDPDKLKRVMENYHALAQGKITERVKEGVVEVLEKAYAAESHIELLETAQKEKVDKAKAEEAFSNVAVSKGSSAYPSSKPAKMPQLNNEERDAIRKMGYASPEEWWEAKQKYSGEVKTKEAKEEKSS